MPIESKKKSTKKNAKKTSAKDEWMKLHSKNFTVRVMKKSEADIFDYIMEQGANGINAATLFKIALREHMQLQKIMEQGKEQEGEE